MRFVRDQRRSLMSSLCGDRVLIEDTIAALPAQIAAGAAAVVPGQPPGEPTGLCSHNDLIECRNDGDCTGTCLDGNDPSECTCVY